MNKPLQHHLTNNCNGGARESHKCTRQGSLTLTWTLRDMMFKLRPKGQATVGQERERVDFRMNILGRTEGVRVTEALVAQNDVRFGCDGPCERRMARVKSGERRTVNPSYVS